MPTGHERQLTELATAGLPSRRSFLGYGAGAVGGLALTSLLSACGSADSGSSSGSIKGLSGSQTIKIGKVVPLTGPLATAYASATRTMDFAIADVNAAGGIGGHKIELLSADDQASPANEPAAVLQLTSKGAKFIAGPIGTSQALSATAITTAKKIISCPYTTANALGDAEKYPYAFQIAYQSGTEAQRMVELLTAKGYRNIGILREESGFGDDMQAAATAALKAAGRSVTTVQTYSATVTDMTPYLSKLKSAGTDAIIAAVAAPSAWILALRGFAQMSWYPTWIGPANAVSPNVMAQVPTQMVQTHYGVAPLSMSYAAASPISDKFQALATRVKADAVASAAPATAINSPFYDYIYLLKDAIERAGSISASAVKAAIESSTYTGVLGSLKFTPQNHTSLGLDQSAAVQLSSYKDPQSMGGIFFARVGT